MKIAFASLAALASYLTLASAASAEPVAVPPEAGGHDPVAQPPAAAPAAAPAPAPAPAPALALAGPDTLLLDPARAARTRRHATSVGSGSTWGSGARGSRRASGSRSRSTSTWGSARAGSSSTARRSASRRSIRSSLELSGRTAVMLGLARLYGGGGAWVGGRPKQAITGSRYGVTGGGHLGVELFLSPWLAHAVEIGGQGGSYADKRDTGASVMGLMTFYPFGG